MNTILPPSRDLPAGRHAEIRAELARAVERRSRRWLFPLATATAALAVIGLVLWLVPWDRGGIDAADTPPPTSPTTSPAPGVPGLTADQAREIAEGCGRASQKPGTFTTYQYVEDAAGKFALVYSDEWVLDCIVGGQGMAYNPGYGGLQGFTPPMSLDGMGGYAGGSSPGSKPGSEGLAGWDFAVGRVAPQVARVVFTRGADSVEATIANGTFVARILHPADWSPPGVGRSGNVRAYDQNGVLIAELPG